jgi:nucleoside-diphosphate-sugar epimerase
VKCLLNNEPIKINGSPKQKVCPTGIKDIVQANILAYESENYGSTFNIAGEISITLEDLVARISQILHKPSSVHWIQDEEIPSLEPDITHARKVLGYIPKVGIEEMVLEVAKSIGENKK